MSDLIPRLRGIYTVPVNDGAGLLDGKSTFTRQFQTPPIQHEAAARIEALEAEIKTTRRQALLDASTEVSGHWNTSNATTNQRDQAIRSAAALRQMAEK